MKALVIDRDGASRDALRRSLAESGEQVRCVETLADARRHFAELLPDLVVVGIDAPSDEAIAFVAETARAAHAPAVLALVDGDLLDAGVAAMESGADDFLWRPVSEARVAGVLARLSRERAERKQSEERRIRLVRAAMSSLVLGQSPRWHAALAAIERAAASGEPVLLAGEAGTEQEEAARAVHGLSTRGSGPFVRISDVEGSLASLPAERGTVFVPSLERRTAVQQEVLFHFLESPSGFRVVLAVNESPTEAVEAGHLDARLIEAIEDRIVHLPPLRERGEDVDLLARHFLEERDPSLSFDVEALDALRAHDWPGNVRELKEVVRRAARLSDGAVVGSTVVLSVLAGGSARRRVRRRKPPVVHIPVGASLADVERRLIQKTLEFARGSKPKTAELLKLSLKTIYNKIKEYGLEH